jgi:hypothetical protein
MCFGAFPFAGQGTIGVGQKTLTQLKEYTPLAHATDIAWPLINAVLADTTMKRKYLAHFKTMLSENITNGNYQTEATQYQSIVNNALFADSNKLFSYQQFQGGLNTDVVFGSFTVPGISNLMEARKTFLQTIPELMAAEPTVNMPVFSQLAPAINTPINVTVAIANANASGAYLGYRFDVKEKFMPLPLLDDGLHNDGNANDGVYGNSFTMSGASMQYYVYAENTSIGKFLPARAEHEFLTFNAAAIVPQVGDLVINEFLAQNDHWNQDEYSDHEDWIELFNKTNVVLDLSNVYVSNNANAIAKWKLPTGTTIMPNAYLTIFADDDSLEKIYHTNFNISKDSGSIVLSNGIVILDSVNYFTQLSDTAYGRLPNGSGAFTYLIPTYGYENNSFPLYSSSIFSPNTHFVLYPNPANHSVTVSFHGRNKVNIFNIFGQPVFTAIANNNIMINTSNWTAGIYLVRCGNATQKLMIIK